MKLKNLIFVFCIILNYYTILAAPSADEVSVTTEPKLNIKTELQDGGMADGPPSPPETTTVAPTTTTVAPETTTITTTTSKPTTTTQIPPETTTTTDPPTTSTTSTTTGPPTTTTDVPTTTPAPVTPTTTTTTTTSTTTEVPPAPKPCRRFDGLSFIGGMILSGGLIPIGLLTWKFYKARTDRNYHTL